MPKTGQERKARRRARKAAEAARASQTAPGGAADATSVKPLPTPGDAGDDASEPLSDFQQAEAELVAAAGDHWATDGNRRAIQKDQRLVHRSLRWRTDATDKTFQGRDPRELTALEIAILKTRATMLDPDPKVAVGLGVRSLIAIEAQNQRDDLSWDPFKQPNLPGSQPTADAPTANVQVVINMPSNGRGPDDGVV